MMRRPKFLMTGQHPSAPYPTPSGMPPETAAGVCALPPYDGRLMGAYPRLADLYGSYPDPVATAASYMSGLGNPVLYPTSLTSPYDLKDPRTAWATLPQAAGYPCDPTFAAYGAYGDRFDPVDSEARRRNATRETTSTLKAWLNEHRKNPYPTKGEKIMLAIITKMTLTQVSTWFANARRRLKKENKMTWEPRNKTGDDLDDVSVDEDDEKDEQNDDEAGAKSDHHGDGKVPSNSRITSEKLNGDATEAQKSDKSTLGAPKPSSLGDPTTPSEDQKLLRATSTTLPDIAQKHSDEHIAEKPKIWSLAQTATSESPPSTRKLGLLDSTSPVDFKRMRLNRMMYHEPFHVSEDASGGYYHRTGRSHQQDSSAESSLSSPPLWRSGDAMSAVDRYGRLTPLENSDVVSVSPSSSSSPAAVVSSSLDSVCQPTLSPGLGYNPRLLGCRLLPCTTDGSLRHHGNQTSPLSLETGSDPRFHHHSQYYSQATAPTLDLRTIHSAFLRSSPFGYPVTFTTVASPQPGQATATLSKAKILQAEDGNRCNNS